MNALDSCEGFLVEIQNNKLHCLKSCSCLILHSCKGKVRYVKLSAPYEGNECVLEHIKRQQGKDLGNEAIAAPLPPLSIRPARFLASVCSKNSQ